MSGDRGQDAFDRIIGNSFGDPDEVRRAREETAVDHFIGLVLDGEGVVRTPEDAENCRAAAAEDIAVLFGCSDEYAFGVVAAIEGEMMIERADNVQA